MTLEKIILEILESRDTTNPTEVRQYCLDGYGLRVERVMDISEDDALKEGCVGTPCNHGSEWACTDCMNTGYIEPPSLDFMGMWDQINKKRGYSWYDNPYAWVIDYKILETGGNK